MVPKLGLLFATISASMSIGAFGCYYPANIAPPQEAKTQTVINVPYDLTWDAVHTVVKNRDYKIEGDDPDHGIVEVESHAFTLADADHINYEATIEDKTIYTRPWKIRTVLYRRKEPGAQLNEFKCVEFAEELIYGDLKKK